MSHGTQLIHQYLRHNKRFPHVFCPGCGHGVILGSLVRSVHAAGLEKDEVVVVAGIGCSGRLAVYVDFNTIHTTHGRALTFATGVKMANPKLTVICIMGDGDALSIGGNHLIHAARRNVGVTAMVLNNNIYGMTGGQCSSTTPMGARSMTTPHGQLEQTFDIAELVRAAGASYVARATAFHATLADEQLTHAFTRSGFSLVEIFSPCHTQYGRKNQFKTIVSMYEDLKQRATPMEKWREMEPSARGDRFPIGVFEERDEPSLEQRYAAMRQGLCQPKEPATKVDTPEDAHINPKSQERSQ